MNKKDYVLSLLSLCTEKQKDIFNRMYPDGVEKPKLNWAITQLENTLKKGNEEIANLKFKINEQEAKIDYLNNRIAAYEFEISDLELDLSKTEKQIERLENPINTTNADIQRHLDKLDALEAGGVDNWEWYEESLKDAGLE